MSDSFIKFNDEKLDEKQVDMLQKLSRLLLKKEKKEIKKKKEKKKI
ncbi:hypothetical protein ACEE06_11965 [Staphylococcus epidermidis]